ncbi:MAG: VOC family protein [Acidimicrobiia bacterium]|nr:VOC family protein [Acidimicrobiia bacterium]
MRRMHLGITVTDIDAARTFYTKLLGEEPALDRGDYVKWMIDDPRINLSINTTACGATEAGVNHLGIQVETKDELHAIRTRWHDEGMDPQDQTDLVCGYQRQDKSWVFDPHELPWEVFITHGVVDDYGTNEMPDPG